MFLKLLLLFIITPILEMAVLIELGKLIGTWQTIGIVVITGIIGASLAKSQGFLVYINIRNSLYRGELPHNHLIEGLLILIGGALLITPGILTDFAGFMFVVPWTRKLIREWVKRYFRKKFVNIRTDEFGEDR